MDYLYFYEEESRSSRPQQFWDELEYLEESWNLERFTVT